MTTRIEGSALADIAAHLEPVLEAALDDAAVRVRSEAQALAPGSGALRASIEIVAGADPLTTRVVAGAPYAKFVEFGTRHVAARPFLHPALALEKPRLVAALSAALAGALSRLGRTKP